MASINDMVTYTPAGVEEECKMERSFDNDVMDVTCAGVEECEGSSPMVDEVYDEHAHVRE